MKVVSNSKRVIRAIALFIFMGSVVTFTSCDDDDDNNPPPFQPSVTDVRGEYQGKVNIFGFSSTNPDDDNSNVGANVKNDSVNFVKFPIDELVIAIVGSEEAPGIIEKLGDISYKVGYKAELNTANDSIYMALDPKPLEFILPGEGENTSIVKVTMLSSLKGNYAYDSDKLKFNLTADEITVDDVSLGEKFKQINLNFDLDKK